jgi:hypothetical protein
VRNRFTNGIYEDEKCDAAVSRGEFEKSEDSIKDGDCSGEVLQRRPKFEKQGSIKLVIMMAGL